jgi:L-fuculose-phosphate aldolase
MVKLGKRLHAEGFVAATDGNLSARLDERSIIITPTGFSKAAMKPADMVIVDFCGKKISGIHNPSSELESTWQYIA